MSLFGDSVENIEFVIESDDEAEDDDDDDGIGSKENPIIIHVTNINEKSKGLIVNQNLSKLPGKHYHDILLFFTNF